MDQIINTLEQYSFLNNTAWNYATALAVLLGSLVTLKLFQVIILSWLKRLAKKTKNDLDDAFVEALSLLKPRLYIIVAVYIAFRYLAFSDTVNKVILLLFLLVVAEGVIRAIGQLVDYATRKYMGRRSEGAGAEPEIDPRSNAMVRIFRNLAVVALWIVALLFLLSNFGVNISSVIASLGIGGIAVALAVQNILGDIFSSFSLFIDKPFEVGDFIQIGTDKGTVEKIGLKTTRIKTPRGEELVVSNKELTTARVQNFKKLERRQDVLAFGVVYGVTQTKLKEIPKIVKEVVKKEKHANFDRCHLINFGDSSLDFEVVYFVDSDDYKVFLNTKQSVMLGIYTGLIKEEIEFAYPTRTVIVEKD